MKQVENLNSILEIKFWILLYPLTIGLWLLTQFLTFDPDSYRDWYLT